MELEINRVYIGNYKEYSPVIRRKKIFYNAIECFEEEDDGRTELTMAWGEKMIIDLSYDATEIMLEEFKKQLEAEAKGNDIINGGGYGDED